MDKEKVLKNRLSFLDPKELDKEIEKYKNSKLDIEEIVKEVCIRHKVNYEYLTNNKLDKSITNISNIVAQYIKDIIKIVKRSVYSRKLESFLEICVKIIVFILVVLFMKLPFIILEGVIKFVNDYLFYPFNNSFNTSGNIILSIIYLLMCIFSLIKIFGNAKLLETKKVPKEKIESVDKDYKWLDFIIRVIIYMLILIPIIILIIIFSVMLGITVYLIINGINIIGLSILFIGIISLLSIIFTIIKDSLNHKNKSRLMQLFICSTLFVTGVFISIYDIYSFETPKTLEKSVIQTKTETIDVKLNSLDTKLYVRNGNYELITDDTIEENIIKVEVTYYDDYVDIIYSQQKNGSINYLIFKPTEDETIDGKLIVENIYKDLKNGYLFNYSNVKNITIKIYGNNETIKSIENNNK